MLKFNGRRSRVSVSSRIFAASATAVVFLSCVTTPTQGQEPQYKPEQYPQYKPEQYPQYKPQQYPQYKPEQYPQYKPEQYPQYKPEQYPGYKGSPEDQQACIPDVFRLCNQSIPDVPAIIACLTANKSKLSPACRGVFARSAAASKKARVPRSRPGFTRTPGADPAAK